MSKYSEQTGVYTKELLDSTLDTKLANVDTQVNVKLQVVDDKIAAMPDVESTATQKAVAMAIVLG